METVDLTKLCFPTSERIWGGVKKGCWGGGGATEEGEQETKVQKLGEQDRRGYGDVEKESQRT